MRWECPNCLTWTAYNRCTPSRCIMKHEKVVEMNLQYFLEFYNNLDDDMFCLTTDTGNGANSQADAWGWLTLEEQYALYDIIYPYGMLVCVNDGIGEYANVGGTIKARVTGFLQHIVRMRTSVA